MHVEPFVKWEEDMAENFTAEATVVIEVGPERVWDALTNPALIKQYLFGTEVSSEWKVGSSITYRGEWQGGSYEDKGTILEMVPRKLLKSTYWSSISGLPDRAENYNTVLWEIDAREGGTVLSITQDNNPSSDSAQHAQQNWEMVLAKIKELLES